jgi:hypothetical protein
MIFNVSIALHAFYGPSWQVEVQGESLSWYKSCNGNVIEEKNIILTHSAIATFIKKCEELGVFIWEPHYLDCCMLDGASWSVIIRSENSMVRSTGTNGYPDNWAEFCTSLAKLAQLDANPCKTMV